MLPALRIMVVREDAAESGMVVAVRPEEDYVDALRVAVSLEDADPPLGDWRCEGCGQKWSAEDVACGYCGQGREDIDVCE